MAERMSNERLWQVTTKLLKELGLTEKSSNDRVYRHFEILREIIMRWAVEPSLADLPISDTYRELEEDGLGKRNGFSSICKQGIHSAFCRGNSAKWDEYFPEHDDEPPNAADFCRHLAEVAARLTRSKLYQL